MVQQKLPYAIRHTPLTIYERQSSFKQNEKYGDSTH